MGLLILFSVVIGATLILVHLVSITVAAVRIGASGRQACTIFDASAVSILRPVCGLENFVDETLRLSIRRSRPSLMRRLLPYSDHAQPSQEAA
jgi:ceramide glucosyltransferase